MLLAIAESRSFLQTLGMAGEIIATPGHSDDSVSLVLDDGNAWIGDLTPPAMADDENREVVAASWAKLAGLHVKRVYSGHAPDRPFATFVA
jgi:glyoxylase-like metal-dependent hydrolase (beta-lactamase superfamily II)